MRSLVCWSAGLMSVVFAVAAVGLFDTGRPLAAQPVAAVPGKKAPGTELIPVEGFAVLSVNVSKMHDAEAAKPIRDALEKGDRALLKRIEADYGLTLDQIDRLTFYMPDAGYGTSTESAAVFVTTRKPVDKAKLLKVWKASTEPKNGGVAVFGVGAFGQLGFAGGKGAFGNLGNFVVPAQAPGAVDQPETKKAEEKPKELDLNAAIYYCGSYGETAIVPIDDRTVVLLPTSACGPTFVAGLLRRKADGPLAEALALAEKHDVVVGVHGKALRQQIKMLREGPVEIAVGCAVPGAPPIPVPPPGAKPDDPANPPKVEDQFTPYEPLIELDRAVATFDFGLTSKLTVTAHFPTSEAAKKAEAVAKTALKDVAEALTALRKTTAADAAEKDWLPVYDYALAGLKSAKVTQDGKVLTATATADIGAELKAAFAVLPTKIQEAADRMRLSNNLRQLGLALHNYHDANGHLPRDVTDGEGKVLLSWRVELLPYLEANDLYTKIDRTRAWDDPANKKLWDEMPDAFKVPARPTKEAHETYFQAFRTLNWVGKDDPWLVDTHPVTFTDVTDGTAHTLAIAEMEVAKNWMQPGDPIFDPKKLARIGNPQTGRAGVVMLDGSVRTLDAKKYAGEKLAAIITTNSGDEVDENDFK